MIPKITPTVHRFIHFTKYSVCAIILFFALTPLAHASNDFVADGGGGVAILFTDNDNLSGADMYNIITATTTSNFNTVSLRLAQSGSGTTVTTISPIIYSGSYGGTVVDTCSSVSVSSLSFTDPTTHINSVTGTSQVPFVNFTCTGAPMIAGTTYYISMYHVSRWSHTDADSMVIGGGSSSSNPNSNIGFYPYGSYGSEGIGTIVNWSGIIPPTTACTSGSLGNCIDTVSPYDKQSIATSSLPWLYETTGYIATGDYQSGARLQITVNRNTDSQSVGALTAFNSAFGNNTYLPLGSSGQFDVSTSTIVNTLGVNRIGDYTMYQTIQTPGIGVHWWVFNFNITYNTLVSTSTTFTISTSTAIDNILSGQETALQALTGSTGQSLAGCQFNWWNSAVDFSLGSNLMNCMTSLSIYFFVPTDAQLQGAVQGVKDGALQRAPWGYVTRFVTILSASTTPTSLPTWTAIVATSPTSSTTFTFDPGDMLAGGANTLNSITDPNSGQTLKQVAEPLIDLFIALSFVIIVFHDLMAMGHHKKPPPSAK